MINNISVTNTITIWLNDKTQPTELTRSEAIELRNALNIALNDLNDSTYPTYPYYLPNLYKQYDYGNDIWCSKTSSIDTNQFHTY